MSISLDKFMNNLEQFKENPIETIKEDILELMYAILYTMGAYTITDTAKARGEVIKKFADKYFSGDYGGLDKEIYRYWELNGYPENMLRDFNSESSTLSEKQSKKSFNVNISSSDPGLYAQENANGSIGGASGTFEGKKYPSDAVGNFNGTRDNSGYKVHHISYVAHMINSGDFVLDGNFNISYFVDEICKKIESKLFK